MILKALFIHLNSFSFIPFKISHTGDSGGPLVATENNTLIGIISWSIGCAIGYPDIHTNVYHQIEWINDEMLSHDYQNLISN